MIGFLDCVKQLGQAATKEDPMFELPYKYEPLHRSNNYRIDGSTVGGLNIKFGTGDENWTKANKYLLTNLKWLIIWLAKDQLKKYSKEPTPKSRESL